MEGNLALHPPCSCKETHLIRKPSRLNILTRLRIHSSQSNVLVQTLVFKDLLVNSCSLSEDLHLIGRNQS